MLVSKVPVTLFFPLCDPACLSGGETGQQSYPFLLDLFFVGARMGVSDGLPDPATRRRGEFGALAETFLSATRESRALHLGLDDAQPL